MSNWKTYVINLSTAVLRRRFIKREFRKINYTNYEIIDAVNAFRVGNAWLQTQLDEKHLVKRMSGPEIACTLSHKKALEQFISDDTLDHIVILEDDAILPADYAQIVEDAIKYMSTDDIVMLTGTVMEPYDYVPVAKLGAHTSLIQSVDPTARPFGAVCYIMPKEVARKHLKSMYPITDATDSWEYYKQKGSMTNIYLTHPFPVDTEVFQSSRDNRSLKDAIINRVIFYKIPVLYSFFKKRRRVTETARLKNIRIVPRVVPLLWNKVRVHVKSQINTKQAKEIAAV